MPNRAQRRNGSSELDTRIRVTVKGNPYEFSMGDISALDELDYQKATGRTFMSEMAAGEISSVTVAGFVWCLRRRYEKQLPFNNVLAEVTMGDMETLEVLGDDEDDDIEEAPEAAVSPPED
jgi:hypothetical protein